MNFKTELFFVFILICGIWIVLFNFFTDLSNDDLSTIYERKFLNQKNSPIINNKNNIDKNDNNNNNEEQNHDGSHSKLNQLNSIKDNLKNHKLIKQIKENKKGK